MTETFRQLDSMSVEDRLAISRQSIGAKIGELNNRRKVTAQAMAAEIDQGLGLTVEAYAKVLERLTIDVEMLRVVDRVLDVIENGGNTWVGLHSDNEVNLARVVDSKGDTNIEEPRSPRFRRLPTYSGGGMFVEYGEPRPEY